MRGPFHQARNRGNNPLTRRASRGDLSPQAGRGIPPYFTVITRPLKFALTIAPMPDHTRSGLRAVC
jgi:hypothetical protein